MTSSSGNPVGQLTIANAPVKVEQGFMFLMRTIGVDNPRKVGKAAAALDSVDQLMRRR